MGQIHWGIEQSEGLFLSHDRAPFGLQFCYWVLHVTCGGGRGCCPPSACAGPDSDEDM
jgi:hypothetical protein